MDCGLVGGLDCGLVCGLDCGILVSSDSGLVDGCDLVVLGVFSVLSGDTPMAMDGGIYKKLLKIFQHHCVCS